MCAQLLRFSNGLTNQFGVSTVPLTVCGGSEFGFGLRFGGLFVCTKCNTCWLLLSDGCCLLSDVCCLC